MPDLPWYRKAACRGRPLEWWYPNGTKGIAKEHLEAGKRICNTECPVRQECLQYAFQTGEKFGTWGGLAGVVAGEQEHLTERGKARAEQEQASERSMARRNWLRREQAAAQRRRQAG